MPTTLERLQYGFDRDSRRTWRRRALARGEDNFYGYDGLSQVKQSALGNLNLNQSAIAAVPVNDENWDYDPTGNWKGYKVEADGAVALDQKRVHDKGNRLTQIEDEANPFLLDRVGRMTQMSPDAGGDWGQSQKLKWDAWSRITEVKRASDDAVLGQYGYDGLTRRTTRTVAGTTKHIYYSDAWKPLEERKDDETTANVQYLWGARHRDDLVRRDRNSGETSAEMLDETRYVLMDYFSPAAITDESGAVTERYAFSTFGIRRIMASDFSPRSTSECGFEFAFQGQFLDTESGLLNYGYRYYSPFLGRWTAKDPIGEIGGLNLYAFVRNSPYASIDYLGLECQVVIDIGHALSYNYGPNDVPDKCRYAVIGCFESTDALNDALVAAGKGVTGMPKSSVDQRGSRVGPDLTPRKDTKGRVLPPSDDGGNGVFPANKEGFSQYLQAARIAAFAEARKMCDKPDCCKSIKIKFHCNSLDAQRILNIAGMGSWCDHEETYNCDFD